MHKILYDKQNMLFDFGKNSLVKPIRERIQKSIQIEFEGNKHGVEFIESEGFYSSAITWQIDPSGAPVYGTKKVIPIQYYSNLFEEIKKEAGNKFAAIFKKRLFVDEKGYHFRMNKERVYLSDLASLLKEFN